jgi:dissimilatory sulfite reductase (desulfoviridin) alpha/beta subunit
MKEELKPFLEKLELDEFYVLSNIKEVIDSTGKEDTKLKALFKLADIMDMEDKNRTQVTSVTGALFQGFTPEKLEEAERPKEIEDGKPR